MDLLSHVLDLVPVTGSLDVRCHFAGAWRLEPPAAGVHEIHYHVLLRGAAWVETPAHAALALRPGDIVLFPHGAAHQLHDGSGEPAAPQDRTEPGPVAVVTNGADAPATDLLCGRFRMSGATPALLLRHLPQRLVVHSAPDLPADAAGGHAPRTLAGSRLATLIGLMREEALEQAPGSQAMLNHFSAALFGLTLRLGSLLDAAPQGLLALARDERLRPALAALFEQPEAPWSLPQLAALCSMSRATFIRHFETAFGRSANELLTELRMTIAGRALRATQRSIAEIGESVGYQSDAAFQRAFKKHIGITPARWRAEGRQRQAPV